LIFILNFVLALVLMIITVSGTSIWCYSIDTTANSIYITIRLSISKARSWRI